jgi:hypothetical protein
MEKWTRLSADQRENLVAYLDGELEDNLTQQIDKVLVQSEVARHEVEALARTWELLDLLPRPAAREDFTERTLTTLKVSEIRTRLVDQPWFGYVRKGGIGLAWLAGLALCAIVGFSSTTKWIPDPQAEMLANLPLLRNVDTYLEVRDLDFVKELQRAQLFNVGDVEDEPATARRLDIPKPDPVTRDVLETRYAQVAKMPASERQRIQYNWETFRQLSPAAQADLLTLHAELKQQPDAVHALLDTYALWLQTLTPGQRDDLRHAQSTADRLRLVREFRDQQQARRETQLFDLNLDLQRMKPRMPQGPYISQEDLAAAMDVMFRALPPQRRRELQGRSDTERYIETFRHFGWGGPQQLTPEQLDEIVAAIDDHDLHQRWEQARPEQRNFQLMMVLSRGVHARVVSELEPHYPKEEQLREFFAKELDSVQRENLIQMRSEDLTRELLKLYLSKRQTEDPQLKPLLEYAARMREFGRPPEPPGGFRGAFGNWRGGRPPGERPPEDGSRGPRGDDRGPRADSPPPPNGSRPQPPPPERKIEFNP